MSDDTPRSPPRAPLPRGPVLIDRDDPPAFDPASAPPVPEVEAANAQALRLATRLAARPPSRIGRFFWATAGALFSFLLSMAAWSFVTGLMARNPVLGWAATVLIGLFLLAAALVAFRELAAYARLARLDRVQAEAARAQSSGDLKAARRVTDHLQSLYAGRADLRWGRDRLAARADEVFDADALLHLAETELLGPLDIVARREVEAAARSVAAVTALVPLALADVFAALAANLRMVRRIAEIYGGRAGTFGSWRLMRTVVTHLVATGAVAVGDDLVETVAGGGLLSKVSRRFGEGVVNGALTARVGVAAMEVCRPLPFAALPRPRVSNLIGRGLAGLFPGGKD
ncbi:YcjF family protein [Frigidibacter oleivorans]|uniref:YcjF family protein n=1 Tax=Frigidibacter oleivorans TaxID=2487129 RepID=UPI000F8EE930|nr:TIGR01620 family protein [Frigidibacter oleivorans]